MHGFQAGQAAFYSGFQLTVRELIEEFVIDGDGLGELALALAHQPGQLHGLLTLFAGADLADLVGGGQDPRVFAIDEQSACVVQQLLSEVGFAASPRLGFCGLGG